MQVNPNNHEPTNQDIIEVLHEFSNKVDARFESMDTRFDKMDGRMDKMDSRLDMVEGRLDKIDGRLNTIEATMVTKDYLDEKLADLRGDLVVLTRKEDTKLKKLVDVLHHRNLISTEEKQDILSMEPFPQLSL